MHPALLLDEVIRIILDHIDHDSNRPLTLKAFYRLATVCRAWKDPALDYLWASLTSINPLLALLPDVSELPLIPLAILTSLGLCCRIHRTVACPLMLFQGFIPTLRGSEIWARALALCPGSSYVPTLSTRSSLEVWSFLHFSPCVLF
jgi:hypothetical protein